MTKHVDVKPVRTIMGRLSHGCDLLKELTTTCQKEKITLARITAIGATQKAQIAYYDQFHKKYGFEEFDHPMEILQLSGNVSIKDGAPMVHAHVTLADDQGRAFGGHLAEGTIVFACEFMIEQFEGPELVRGFDDVTGLALWKMRE